MKSTRNEILRNISGSIKERNGLTAQYPLYRNRLRPIIISLLVCVLGLFFFGKIVYARENVHRLKSYYSLYYRDSGFQNYSNDAQRHSRNDAYPTGIKICLKHQPEGMTGTIQYQANISGTGWSDTYENGQSIGEGQDMPLEGIRVFLNGDLKDKYDVYYSTLILGEWQPWAKNGEDSNPVGVGRHIDGILITVVSKGEASQVMRIHFYHLIEQFYPNVRVLSFNEVASNVQIQAIGSLQLEEDTEEKGSA